MGKLVDSILEKIPKDSDKSGGPLSDIAGGLSYVGGKIGDGLSYVAKSTSDFVKVDGTNPVGFLINYGIGATQKEPSVTNVVEVAQAGNTAVSETVVNTGNAIKSAGENVVNAVGGGIETVKKILPIVAVGGLALLVLSKKK